MEQLVDADPGWPVDIRLRLDVGYDGSGFSGWAVQPGRRTVQGTLETALGVALQTPPPRLTVAGRTDAGVHARGQVCHLDLPAATAESLEPTTLVRRLARLLPDDLRVRRVVVVSADFDARFAALARRYCYRICADLAAVDPIRRHDVLAWPRQLDVSAMNAAAALLVGEHDFVAFCRQRPGASSVRNVQELCWTADGDLLCCRVVADAFCHQMVRSIVGALVMVGEGAREPAWMQTLLRAGRRDSAVRVLPPHGLTLEEVRYPSASEWAARVATTRAVRSAPSPGDKQPSGGPC